ncbi:MAG: methyltransferase domain-containing protein [Planctomycetota bacterium]|jgi:MoaA/NifB/PqqE/SkfB family radical SAM enzyme/SAM-dependent methyltransferase
MAFNPQQWVRLEFDGVPVYVQPDKPDWFVPNRAGDKILQTATQRSPIDGDIPIQRFLRRLPDSPITEYPGRSKFLDTEHLREIWFHITNRCNMTCNHCLFSSGPDQQAELDARRILQLADQAVQLGCKVFALTGGEPFVHRKFEPMIDGLFKYDDTNVVILTNGTLLRRYGDALKRWPSERLHLQISLDGLQQNHDRIRGQGAFAKLSEELSWLHAQGFPFTISMSVNGSNVTDMPQVVRYAADKGATNLHFMWYFIRGRGRADNFVSPQTIFSHLKEAALLAGQMGISLDNIEALKSQVFAPSGTKHDGGNIGWESVAVGPDDKLYPSAALIGIDDLAVSIGEDLASAWRDNKVLDKVRATTAAAMPSPLKFILAGGDPDHSYMYSGEFVGRDPYWPLYEKSALWLIAHEAGRQAADGPPGLRLKMGDILESCCPHGQVAMTHSNCLLSVARIDGRTAVKEFYKQAVEAPRNDILNPVFYPEQFIEHVPHESRVRSYGCGSPVLDAGLTEGDTVVDLGSGSGVECFIAARLVGQQGRVIGVDMLDNMLALANQGIEGVASRLGYRNLEFRKGYLENLPIDSDSIDVVLSNCVLNLSAHKRRTFAEIYRVLSEGGRMVVSDVVCETEPDPAIRNDDVLRGQCIAGALTQRDLFGLLAESGFAAMRVLRQFPYRKVRGHQFYSITFEACKPAVSERVKVMYRGPFASIVTHQGRLLPVGQTCEVTRDEIRRINHDLFVFDERGSVTNIDLGENIGCGCAHIFSPQQSSCCSDAALIELNVLQDKFEE